MRLLEIITPVLLVIHVLWRAPRPTPIRFLPAVALLTILIHFAIEGYRWQMIPLYALTVLLTALAIFHVDIKTFPSILTPRLVQGGAFLLLVISTALPILLPVPRIPDPSGPYDVGTRIYELTDDSRRELYSGVDEARRFTIQVWYPSEADSSSERAPWMNHAETFAPAISGQIGMPSFFLGHLTLVKIPAYTETEVAQTENPYPVILFSHGWNGFNAQNTSQALELASHGYVVIGVQHTYGAVITVFDDGTIAKNNPSALPHGAPTEEYEASAHILVDQWAGDLGFTLDFMKSQSEDATSPFFGRLDLNSVGVYGHSTGGGAAIQFCGTDPRCIALLGMDPFMRPVSYEVIDAGVTQPSFFMFSQRWADDLESRNNELFNRFYPHVEQPFGIITIDGTSHYDFADLPLLSPLAPQLGLKGPINGKLVNRIVNDYLLSFFDMTLRETSTDLFGTDNQKYREVRFRQ